MGLNATAANATPQLIQLCQSKTVGVFNQDRVDAGDIKTALNDGGAEHHVGFAGIEGNLGAFQLALGHLAMGNQQFQARQHCSQTSSHLFDPFHPGNHVKHLSPPIQFLADGASYRFRIQ